MGELTLVRHVECGQEMGHAEERIPLTALENVCQTPKTPMALVIKVMSFNLCCSGRVHYACHVCVLVRHRISVGHLGRFMDVFSLTGLAGGCGGGRDPPGRWKGECDADTATKASPDAQGEEGV